jgi:hypothetical protein
MRFFLKKLEFQETDISRKRRNSKVTCFLSYLEDRSKDKHIHKNKHDHINSDVEHVCNSGTTLWNLGKEGKEKSNSNIV